MTKYIAYFLYLSLLGMHQVFLKDVTSIFGVTVNMVALIILLLSFYKSDLTVIWFGLAAGIVAFTETENMLGWHTAAICIIGYIACNLKVRLNLDSIMARLLMILGGVFIHNLILLIFSGLDNFLILLLRSVIPGAVYTTVIAWIFFLFKDGKITFNKVKTIF